MAKKVAKEEFLWHTALYVIGQLGQLFALWLVTFDDLPSDAPFEDEVTEIYGTELIIDGKVLFVPH